MFAAALGLACRERQPRAGGQGETAAGFLALVPADATTLVRFPPESAVRARPVDFQALLATFGRNGDAIQEFCSEAAGKGIDPERPGGLALTPQGAWVRFLPALDKRTVALALRERVARGVGYREEGDFVLLTGGGAPGAPAPAAPLPSGDLALRVRHHPLLAQLFFPTDTLELGITCDPAGCLFEGRLLPGAQGATEEALAQAAHARATNLLDLLPSWLPVRVETTLPPTFLAETVASHAAAHAGIKESKDREALVRFLREALTAFDAAGPFAFGVDVDKGAVSVVMTGTMAPGPPSPILNRLRTAERSSFGALILDKRARAPHALGFSAWLVDGVPSLDGLPESLWEMVTLLCDRARGLPVAYAERGDKIIIAAGTRADYLCDLTHRMVATGGDRSQPGWALYELVRNTVERYVLGAIVQGKVLAELPDADRRALAAALGASESAPAIGSLTVAGFLEERTLQLKGRLNAK
ncbi:MAG: hypothetical protein ACT4PV_00410 [Planctomycetaceae bacterium]